MSDIEIPLKEELRGRNIQKILFNPKLSKLFIFQNNQGIAIDMDLNDIRKTIRDFEKKAKGLIDNITKKIVSENISDGLAPYMNKGAKGEQRKGNRTPLVEDATEEIMSKYVFITIEETDEVWYYKDGVYVIGGEILIAKECEKMFGYELDTVNLTQIVGHIKRRTYRKHEELDADINIINLQNGLYDIDNDLLKEHTPYYLSINQKPITYDKNAKAETFEQFLGEVLYKRDIRTAIEAMAYTFERDYPIEVIFTL